MRISIASPEQIRAWSHGEVTRPETINFRTLKPERGGLFCEKIFGPIKDWECHCGRYRGVRYKGIICDKCGVEVTRSKVRRERFGHIELAAPVSHAWYLWSDPSPIGLLLGMSLRNLEKVIYFRNYIVIDPGATALMKRQLLTESEYRAYRERYGKLFKASIGAEAIKKLLEEIDLDELSRELRGEIQDSTGLRRIQAIRRLEVVEAFRQSGNRPEHMILDVLPVIPPELRPMVQLDGDRFATSDLNDLYSRVIKRNNRLKRLLELGAPDIIVHNEKRMLQEAVDALIDNGRRACYSFIDNGGRPITGPGNRPLKSLSDMLRGSQGRFRQNLLGKRVDYSGRSVIVVGPKLKLNQCGLPKEMALELFKPFVMRRLVDLGYAHNAKSAKRMVERVKARAYNIPIWDILEEVIKDHPVLLNRAPTLHRLGIQAFEPILVEGRAIQIHPLVCPAYAADFDGDQMVVYVPLSAEAQAEARLLMMATGNILSPAHGKPIATPDQDLVLGCYYLTLERQGGRGEGHCFTSPEEALRAYEEGVLDLHARIGVRWDPQKPVPRADIFRGLLVTTPGRLIFNTIFPKDFPYINDAVDDFAELAEIVTDNGQHRESDKTLIDFIKEMPEKHPTSKGFLAKLVGMCQRRYGNEKTAEILDNLKAVGFRYATKSGTTVGIEDIAVLPEKQQILRDADKKIEEIERQHRRGLITKEEKHQLVIDTWTEATYKVEKAMLGHLDKFNPVYMMAASGARVNVQQLRELGGMRGLVADPSGRTIDLPIRASFREGLTGLEYFISTYGTRKGLADTALRAADSGYLMRRLVDVSQDVIVREEDCGTDDGIMIGALRKGDEIIEPLRERVIGRVAADDIVDPETGEIIVKRNQEIDEDLAKRIERAGISEVRARSVLTCRTRYGVCSKCYGRNLATGRPVEVGEAVGVIAAQSIGGPWVQLTMETSHTGGVAGDETGDDVTRGLARVEELFEARRPKGQAVITEVSGVVKVTESKGTRKVIITTGDGEEKAYIVPYGARLEVRDGQQVEAGDRLTEGSLNPADILRVKGVQAVQRYLVREVQEVYRSQGAEINDKHIEVIVRQMLRRVRVEDSGDTDLLPGSLVDSFDFEDINYEALEAGRRPATARPVLLGITKASLATESFLSAASFQETTRVLTDASIKSRVDPLIGLKENVIIGTLIPAGTGMPKYRDIEIEVIDRPLLKSAAMAAAFYRRLLEVEGVDGAKALIRIISSI
ncbi:MAG TPA: DNA-directed RNA polymerase subunit beta' [Firmicutes bacterium]|nr:DNA-directed RNA polymerase subunit beta' [Bacillota bacterium]